MFDILLRVSEGQSWDQAILGVLPSRKGALPLKVSNDKTAIAANDELDKEPSSIDTVLLSKESVVCTDRVEKCAI